MVLQESWAEAVLVHLHYDFSGYLDNMVHFVDVLGDYFYICCVFHPKSIPYSSIIGITPNHDCKNEKCGMCQILTAALPLIY